MPRSEAFLRIRHQVLEITASIPPGRLCTYVSIGQHLDVMPRHVAYLLARLDDASKQAYPWHRVVAGDGSLGVPKRGPDGRSQAELLAAEGIVVSRQSVAASLARAFVDAAQLPHGIPPQTRPSPASPSRPSSLPSSSPARRAPGVRAGRRRQS